MMHAKKRQLHLISADGVAMTKGTKTNNPKKIPILHFTSKR
jgi:hypothetical protein